MQHRQQEGGRLAAAGLAGDHQVDEPLSFADTTLVRQSLGDGLQLDRRRLGVAQIGHGLDQFGRQTQQHEAVGGRLLSLGRFRAIGQEHLGGLGKFCRRLSERRIGGYVGGIGGNGFKGRKVAQHFKSVGHFFLTRKRRRGCDALRQWLKNINHQTKTSFNAATAIWQHAGC
jgi:hypothetical protein